MKASELKRSSEQAEQEVLFEWLEIMARSFPELKTAIHIPNEGKRSISNAMALKRAGLRRGAPDVFIPVPNEHYHGLFIEMKYGKNKPTKEQKEYLNAVSNLGYKTAVCYSADKAIKIVTDYLSTFKRKDNHYDNTRSN